MDADTTGDDTHLAPTNDGGMMRLTPSPEMLTLAQRNSGHSPVFRLSPELRNKICALVLGDRVCHIDGGVEFRSNEPEAPLPDDAQLRAQAPRSNGSLFQGQGRSTLFNQLLAQLRDSHRQAQTQTPPPLPGNFLALLLVCRQLYTETALLPFVLNTFAFSHYETFEKWVAQNLLPGQRDAIAAVKCPLEQVYNVHGGGFPFTTFSEFDGVKKIVLTREPMLDEEFKTKIERQFRESSGKETLKVRVSA